VRGVINAKIVGEELELYLEAEVDCLRRAGGQDVNIGGGPAAGVVACPLVIDVVGRGQRGGGASQRKAEAQQRAPGPAGVWRELERVEIQMGEKMLNDFHNDGL